MASTSAFQPNAFQNSNLTAFEAFQTNPLDLFQISGLDPSAMQVLGTSSAEQLLWDYSNTEQFYILAMPPEYSPSRLFRVTPVFARNWIIRTATTVLYNPFIYNPTNLSNL